MDKPRGITQTGKRTPKRVAQAGNYTPIRLGASPQNRDVIVYVGMD